MQRDQSPVSDFFANARKELPPNFALTAVPVLLPGMTAIGTVYNAISAKAGPPFRKINGRIILERDSFLDWIQNRPRASKRVAKEGRGDA